MFVISLDCCLDIHRRFLSSLHVQKANSRWNSLLQSITYCRVSKHVFVCAVMKMTTVMWAPAVLTETLFEVRGNETASSLAAAVSGVRSWTVHQPRAQTSKKCESGKPGLPRRSWLSVCVYYGAASAKFPGTISLFSLWFFPAAETKQQRLWQPIGCECLFSTWLVLCGRDTTNTLCF